jgi:hypothetical protein
MTEADTIAVASARPRPPVYDELLRSTARLARLTSSSRAASVFLYDGGVDALVLEASSGHGEDRLIGLRVPAHAGIAGWVHQTGEAILVNGVRDDPRFDLATATSTGYVPDTIVAAPIVSADRSVGVVELLDPDLSTRDAAATMDLLSELATHCCAALLVLGGTPDISRRPASASHLIAKLQQMSAAEHPTVDEFLRSLDNMLTLVRLEGR